MSYAVKRIGADGVEHRYEITPLLRFIERRIEHKDGVTFSKIMILQQFHKNIDAHYPTEWEWLDVELRTEQ